MSTSHDQQFYLSRLCLRSFVCILSVACYGVVIAQEPIAKEQLQNVIPRMIEHARNQADPPLAVEVDAEKALGMKIKDYGVVTLPARELSTEMLSKVKDGVMPVGQLWLSNLAPMSDGKKIASEKLSAVKVGREDNQRTLQMLLLGVRKRSETESELVVFSKGREPLLTVPLKKLKHSQSLPLEFEMKRGTESFGVVTVHIAGQYEAEIAVAESLQQ